MLRDEARAAKQKRRHTTIAQRFMRNNERVLTVATAP